MTFNIEGAQFNVQYLIDKNGPFVFSKPAFVINDLGKTGKPQFEKTKGIATLVRIKQSDKQPVLSFIKDSGSEILAIKTDCNSR